MSITDVVSRVSEIEALTDQSVTPGADPAAGSSSFPDALAAASIPGVGPQVAQLATTLGIGVPTGVAAPAGSGEGARVLAQAESQVGQSEQPPGSNDGPALATYRSAVAGAAPGEPWCAYFASWCAQQAGVPLGDQGQGLGYVGDVASWASRTGRLVPAGSTPQPGDLILYGDRHVGIVESVAADGSLTTIEGNYSNAVTRVHRSPSEATGYVRL